MNENKLSKLEQQEVAEVLAGFGLKKNEQGVYLALLQTGQTTITPLARAIDLPTTTVQSILARLAQTGIVAVSKNKSRHVYEAHDPKVFVSLLEQQKNNFSNLLPILRKLESDSKIETKVRVYYRERVTDIFQKAIGCKSKMIYEVVSATEFQKILGEKFHFTRQRIKNNVKLQSLRVEDHEIKKYSKKTHEREMREAKFLPRELTFEGNILAWDNTVALFSTKAEGIAITIESKSIQKTVLQIFNLLWSVSRRMETLEET